MVNYSLLF